MEQGGSTCGASEQDQVGDPDSCPKGWHGDSVRGVYRVGLADRNNHYRGVAGAISFCQLCGAVWGEQLTVPAKEDLETVATRQ